MKDLCLKGWTPLEDMVLRENQRQLDKWGIQDHDPFEWLGLATEELGELSDAIVTHKWRGGIPENVVKEAIQTATLCLKIAEMYQALLVTEVRQIDLSKLKMLTDEQIEKTAQETINKNPLVKYYMESYGYWEDVVPIVKKALFDDLIRQIIRQLQEQMEGK